MKEKKEFILKTLKLLSIIILYYIIGKKNIFLYVLSITLYNIFTSCFNHISIKENLSKIETKKSKYKLFKLLLLVMTIISFLFLLLSIFISDFLSIFLNINNITLIFIFEGLSIITKPLVKLLSEYLQNIKNNYNYNKLINIFNILDNVLLLIIALFTFRILKLKENIAISLLYLSKILSTIIILLILYLINRPLKQIKEFNDTHTRKIKVTKCKLKSNKYQLEADKQFDISSELERLHRLKY